ncbi:TPA: hypothetical protein N0F65_007788 [Lagenidium giganteum]|uniref:Non-specific serine/threonine protein kinase n=1 Tax=Lagenidium giganteum TaxID=4803 RepID=A0AAV2YYM1_9STRA|nr:TPA: hypothetical protein N0F65_007788 [Lagenidium giganteum]
MDEVQLECGVYGEATVFPVKIARCAKTRREGNSWLIGGEDVIALLRGMVEVGYYPEMLPWWHLEDYLGTNFQPGRKEVHVLVDVTHCAVEIKPVPVGRLVQLQDVWDYSLIHKMTALPKSTELKAILLSVLPFQLLLSGVNAKTAGNMFKHDGEILQCYELSTIIESCLLECTSMAFDGLKSTQASCQTCYDALFSIPRHICAAYGIYLAFSKNQVDRTGTSVSGVRPNLILHHHELVLLRGEDEADIDTSRNVLTQKMRKWNSMFYGELPYILGFATSGMRLQIFTIDRRLHTNKIADFNCIIAQKEAAIKAFYNLSFFLVAMIRLSKRTRPSELKPQSPQVTDKRTIELMDDCIRRTIQREQCRDEADFQRIIAVYSTLQRLRNNVCGRTHLQTVRKLILPDQDSSSLIVQLEPLGFFRLPENAEEVYVWLEDMLTALANWHSCYYCHGDICWRNIVYVPTSDRAYWVLIDMDKSHRCPWQGVKAPIHWAHQWHGDTLKFEHDLYQLGQLMESFSFPLTERLRSVQKVLLSAVATQERSATAMVKLLHGGT